MLPWVHPTQSRARQILASGEEKSDAPATRRMRAEDRSRLLIAIAKARLWVKQLTSGEVIDTSTIARREGCSERSVRMTMSFAFLPPALLGKLSAGRLPNVRVTDLVEQHVAWSMKLSVRRAPFSASD